MVGVGWSGWSGGRSGSGSDGGEGRDELDGFPHINGRSNGNGDEHVVKMESL